MNKNKIIFSSAIGIVSFALALTACAQAGVAAETNVSVRVPMPAHPGPIASSTVRANIEARYGSSTAAMRMGSTTMHMASTTRMSSTGRMENQQQRITRIQGRSDTEITQRINSMDQLLARIESMKNISSSDQSNLVSSIQNEIASLTSLKASIAADSSTTTLKADAQSITKSYRVYLLILPQANITAAGDRVLDLVSSFNTLATKLQGYITTAQNNGTDVSAANSAMSDISAKVGDASVQANAAISEVASLQPDQGATSTLDANTAALKDAKSKIQAATADIAAARKDLNTIVGAIKDSISLNASATVTASTTAQ